MLICLFQISSHWASVAQLSGMKIRMSVDDYSGQCWQNPVDGRIGSIGITTVGDDDKVIVVNLGNQSIGTEGRKQDMRSSLN